MGKFRFPLLVFGAGELSEFMDGQALVIRKGAKHYHVIRLVGQCQEARP